MAEDGPAGSLHSEASCSLCLQLFQDPVSIHCGHTFCRGCIEGLWGRSEPAFPCPLCRETAPEPGLRPNRELAQILSIARRLSLRVPRAGQRLCPRHGQALKLFCEEEQTPVCLACRESPSHRPHSAVPIEEAAEERKEKLQAHVQILRDRREKLQGMKEAEEGKSLELLERVDAERRKVVSEIRELRQLLERRERLLLERLAGLERRILERRERSLGRLSEQLSGVAEQIRELEEKCRQPPWELLEGSRDVLSRLEKESAQEAAETPPEPAEQLTGPPQQSLALREMLLMYQEIVRLDADTAHPRLALSQDGRAVRWQRVRLSVADLPGRFDASRCVLGRGGFSSGRHYWEVAVGDGDDGGDGGTAWALGVARESVPRKGRLRVSPAGGVWAVGRCGGQCQALASPAAPLALHRPPRLVGVYLDYEQGRVAFFDAAAGAPLFAFPPAAFGGERVLPLLCLGRGGSFALSP